jgi:hypothetical protein
MKVTDVLWLNSRFRHLKLMVGPYRICTDKIAVHIFCIQNTMENITLEDIEEDGRVILHWILRG